jgi:hypothetical protein
LFLIARNNAPPASPAGEELPAKEVADDGWDSGWIAPPANAGPDRLFPEQIRQFKRNACEQKPTLELELYGEWRPKQFPIANHHATYDSGPGPGRIQVYACRADTTQRDMLMDWLVPHGGKPGSNRLGFGMSKCGNDPLIDADYAAWYRDGWLLWMDGSRLPPGGVQQFLKAYVRAIGKKS